MSFVYLASPYTPHADESVQDRVDAACKYAARLMGEGHSVFSPIAHSHYVANHMDDALRMDHEFWMRQDLAILPYAARMVVLKLPGWERSRGIAREITEAKQFGVPVEYAEP